MLRLLAFITFLTTKNNMCVALQPPPQKSPPPLKEGCPALHLSATDTLRRYRNSDGGSALMYPCGAGPVGSTQTFYINSTTNVISGANNTCLFRAGSTTATSYFCDGSPQTTWTYVPCTATGCDQGSNQSWITSSTDGHVLGIPGSIGPSVDVWTVDNPTGSFHNELWAYSASDQTIRTLNTGGPPSIFNQCLTLTSPPQPCSLSPRVLCHPGIWTSAPSHVPSNGVIDGPLLGNGDVGSVLTTTQNKGGVYANESGFTWYFGKNDMWSTNTASDEPVPSLHSDTFYTAISAGVFSVSLANFPTSGTPVFTAVQDLSTASVNTTLNISSSSTSASVLASMSSAIIAKDENTMIANFAFSGSSSPLSWTFTLETETQYGLPLNSGGVTTTTSSGSSSSILWASKQGVKTEANSMILMPCDITTYVIHPAINTFTILNSSTGRVAVYNATGSSTSSGGGVGSSFSLCPTQIINDPPTVPNKLSIGPCSDENGNISPMSDWRIVPSTVSGSPTNAMQLQAGYNSSLCGWVQSDAVEYHNSGGFVSIGLCDTQSSAWWYLNATTSAAPAGIAQIQYNASQCLTAVPPNLNITLGLAFSIISGVDGSQVPLSLLASPSAGPSTTVSSVMAAASLQPDTPYILVVSAITTRDTDWATDPADAAVASVALYANNNLDYVNERRNVHSNTWTSFWNVSSIELSESRQLLEGAWYGFQYNLESTTAQGEISPGLWGVWAVSDGNGWNGDHTLDYNAQANFYGSCSSNHCEQLMPYMNQVASDWHVEVSRQRARANWEAKGSAGAIGQTSQSMCCGYMDAAYENPHICPSPTTGNYSGIEMTTHIGPFPGLFYFSDLSLRVVALMSTKPYIDYFEYMGDITFLGSTAYPMVNAAVDFFFDYVTPNATTGVWDILNACAQEICGGGPESEFNPHHTIAYLTTATRALLRYSVILNRDIEKIPLWNSLLAHLPSYPTTTHNNQVIWSESEGTGSFFPSNGAAYSIVYTAALHPAESVVGLSDDPVLLDIAWNTIEQLASVNSWYPLNGLCMAWCPATRIANYTRAASVLSGWEGALESTMYNNFYPNLGGGGIEQFGAAEAINSALVQSNEGFIRFFPMWPLTESAAFTNLRVRGAFIVSAAWDGATQGIQGDILIVADGTLANYDRNCTFMSPFAGGNPPSVTIAGSGGAPVEVMEVNAVLNTWTFSASPKVAGGYVLRSSGSRNSR